MVKFTENLGVETRRHGISVFSVHPGIDVLLNRADDVLRDDLHVLRLHGLPKTSFPASTGE